VIDTQYLYEDFNGLDWDAVHEEMSAKISAGMTEGDFYDAMREMIHLLGDEHSQYFSPEDAQREDEEFAGMYDYVGIGIMTTPIFEEKRIVIITVFPGSPAEEAGLKVRDSILAADGQPVIEGDIFRHDLLLGPDGSTYTLTVQSPGEAPRDLLMQRRRITGNLEIPSQVLTTPNGKKIAYIFLLTFNDDTVDDQVGAAIAELSASHDLDGIIIDNRVNSGGAGNVLEGVLSYFTSGTIGTYVNREKEEALHINGRDINGSQSLPMVILTGKETASFGEIFSGVLQDINRAYLIGEATASNVEILYVYNFSDGSRAWIAHDTFQPLNNPDQDWERTGVIPDLLIKDRWDEVSIENDEIINAALKYFDEN
jgi:carboxyl-terminal processing protease